MRWTTVTLRAPYKGRLQIGRSLQSCPTILLAICGKLAAHEGRTFEAHDLLTEWVWDPLIVLPIVVSAWLYAAGSRKAEGLARWEKACFWTGWISLVLALMSPLHPMGESLFSAHMAQHELLMVISAPLLVLGRPLIAFLWALPQQTRRSAGAFIKFSWVRHPWEYLTRPLVAFTIHFAAVWLWHVPAAYDASVTSDAVHTAQHASFLGSALLFWWAAIRQHVGRKHYGPGLFYIFATAIHTSILGALLTFSNVPWYAVYRSTVGAWGLTPLEDQQLGGLIMWIPPAFVYLAIFLWIFAQWMHDRPLPQRMYSLR